MMTPEEKETLEYQKLTKFQKDVVDALRNIGFSHKCSSAYEKDGWRDIDVSKFSRWSDILQAVHKDGKIQKAWELQRVLEIGL